MLFGKKKSIEMLIIAFESSCDETSVSVAEFEKTEKGCKRRILSLKTASQIPIHALYGGVVPEIASRAHVESISSLTHSAISESGYSPEDMDAVAVTNTPGLVGALLVAVNYAKAFALRYKKPLVPVNHIRGHIAAAYYEYEDLEAPFFALVASGGHTSMVEVKSPTEFITVARTRDDAAGEAFDKVARILGIPYPGGAALDELAYKGNPNAIRLPYASLSDSLDFSFSGIKTAVINYANTEKMCGRELNREDVAASFTNVAVESILRNIRRAHKEYGFETLVVSGGVAANNHLREKLSEFQREYNVRVCIPSKAFCGDNAAMIAAQGYYEYMSGARADSSLNAKATARLESNI